MALAFLVRWLWRQCGAPVEAEQWRERASGRQGAGSGVREQMRVAEAMEGARARGTQGPWVSSLGELLGRIWSEVEGEVVAARGE